MRPTILGLEQFMQQRMGLPQKNLVLLAFFMAFF